MSDCDETCDGEWHDCHDCEEGFVFLEDEFGEETDEIARCRTCGGKGGWPCPELRNVSAS